MSKWIIVVDDDTANLKMAGHILSKNNMRVTALKSGNSFLDYVNDNGMPDLVLLDIKMPVMDGFETLGKLRQLEQAKGLMKTPVIFLTADEDVDTETRGFEVGVSDFIRKPFNPDVLLRRIGNIMSNSQEMHDLKSEATIDKLTGFLNKGATGVELSKMCSEQTGCLMMIDLDSFKLVNDIYGHEMGDKVLIACADIIRNAVPEGSKCGRIGGDEFVAFASGVTSESKVSEISKKINDEITRNAKVLMGDDMSIPIGASIGGIFVPRFGNDYNTLLKLADKSLYIVKKNGKHGYGLYDDDIEDDTVTALNDIHAISEILGERSIQDVALQLDKDSFSPVYRYVIRYIMRHHINACKVLFTLEPASGTRNSAFFDRVDEFGNHIRGSLRKSDIFMRNSKNQYFVFLTDIRADSIDKVISHIIDKWHSKSTEDIVITYETEFIGSKQELSDTKKLKKVVVVDDDIINLQVAGKILSSGGIHVTALRSGDALFNYLEKENELPNLILLDVKMPGMRKTRENKDLFLQVVSSLAAAIDTKDEYTKGHSSRVAEYARMIAKRSGFSDARQDEIYMLGLLHDVGKIGIPNGLLNKPGTLTDDEFAQIRKHSAMGASILKNIENDPKFEQCAMYHHERYDGTGYPTGIKGTEIPEEARIIAVADAYDAMSSDRSYRSHLTQDEIKNELELGMGTQFDPKFAGIMLAIVEEDKEYRYRG